MYLLTLTELDSNFYTEIVCKIISSSKREKLSDFVSVDALKIQYKIQMTSQEQGN